MRSSIWLTTTGRGGARPLTDAREALRRSLAATSFADLHSRDTELESAEQARVAGDPA